MSKTARMTQYKTLAVVLITLAALLLPRSTWAASGNVQICNPSSSCTIGEFLYDDNYAPITVGASCTITSRYPNGSLFLDAQSLTNATESDGWYYHTFTAPSTLGLYRTVITCVVSAETMSLDKSFEVQSLSTAPSANDVAAATWSYSTRSLTSFGNLISDIWSSATRTLTGAGLSSGELATKSDVTSITTTSNSTNNNVTNVYNGTKEIRDLLEKLVNKPVVETQAIDVPDLRAKLTETENKVSQLSKDTKSINSQTINLLSKWDSISEAKILESIEGINKKFGGENDKDSSKTMFGTVNFLARSWEWTSIENLKSNLKASRDISFSLQKDLETKGKSSQSLYKVRLLARSLGQLDTFVGSDLDSGTSSIYASLNETKALAKGFDSVTKDVDTLLVKWNKYEFKDKKGKIYKIAQNLLEINKIPGIRRNLLVDNSTNDKELKNKGYSILGIASTNKVLLAQKSGSTLSNTWLELGSIVFKSIASNPSTYLSQDVELKYYLPPEIKKEHIIETDEGLEVKYDNEKDQFYVSGSFYLAPNESRTYTVKTEDIWVIKQVEIDSLRKQAEELSKPLEKTSFFAQGVTLKTDIDASLSRVEVFMERNSTPEIKIRSYREAQIELVAAREKIEKLKELATQVSSAGAFFGFVGGAQAIAVWGLVLIIIVGFVSLTIYIRMLSKKEKKYEKKTATSKIENKDKSIEEKAPLIKHNSSRIRLATGFGIVMLLIGAGVGGSAGFFISRMTYVNNTDQKTLARNQQLEVLGTQVASIGKEDKKELNIKAKEASTSSEFDNKSTKTVIIKETPTGFLRVRKAPGGIEIAKVDTGKTYPYIQENSGWVQIELEDGEKGWVSKEYIEITTN